MVIYLRYWYEQAQILLVEPIPLTIELAEDDLS